MEWFRLTVQAFLRYNSSPGIPMRAMIRQYIATTGSTVILDNTGLTYSDTFPNMFMPVELTTECPRDRAIHDCHRKLFWDPLGNEYVYRIGMYKSEKPLNDVNPSPSLGWCGL